MSRVEAKAQCLLLGRIVLYTVGIRHSLSQITVLHRKFVYFKCVIIRYCRRSAILRTRPIDCIWWTNVNLKGSNQFALHATPAKHHTARRAITSLPGEWQRPQDKSQNPLIALYRFWRIHRRRKQSDYAPKASRIPIYRILSPSFQDNIAQHFTM